MPLKWIILGAFIAGVAVANIISATRNGSTSGCDFLGSSRTSNPNSNDGSTGRTQANTNDSAPAANSNSAADGGGDSSANANSSTENANAGGSNANDNSNGGGGNDNSAPANQNANDGGGQTNSNSSANANANDNSGDTSVAITGQFAGTLQRANAQSLGGDLPPPRITTSSQAMEFADTFSPVFITVLNYAGAPDRPLTSVQRGNTQTLTATLGSKQITLDVTVREATYQRRQMHAVLDINYRSTSGNLTETGTGVQTIDCALDASDNLTVSSGVHYEIRLSAGGIIFNTIEETSLTGTLNRE